MYKLVKINPGTFNIEENFWKLNPQLKYIPPFNKIYQWDDGKEDSSKTMWCIWMICDPSYENKIYRQPPDRQESAIKFYYPKFKRDHKEVQEIISVYNDIALSSIARTFKEEESSMAGRAAFLSNTGYTLDYPARDDNGRLITDGKGLPVIIKGTAVQLDTIRKNSAAIYRQYDEIRSMFEEEQSGTRIHGGRGMSARERNKAIIIQDDEDGDN